MHVRRARSHADPRATAATYGGAGARALCRPLPAAAPPPAAARCRSMPRCQAPAIDPRLRDATAATSRPDCAPRRPAPDVDPRPSATSPRADHHQNLHDDEPESAMLKFPERAQYSMGACSALVTVGRQVSAALPMPSRALSCHNTDNMIVTNIRRRQHPSK
ncbi:hypothetical protein RR48_12143 [Papilio machaon]|uniref:Uncharacterized protein n=1 Tax=Papilio machaon TaxID=76193 RepID=A0A194QTR2_PAPMA|nr:hypothetical protein RR48_12143 [Papilio machaon]